MFNKVSLKQKVILYTSISLLLILTFAYNGLKSIKTISNSISTYKEKAVKGKIIILSIEKDMNYISRCSRDIMIGNDYLQNINKIEYKIKLINKNFNELENTIYKDNTNNKLLLIRQAKTSTLDFINGLKVKMLLLEHSNLRQKQDAYINYKKDLTPIADKSRKYFTKIRQMKENDFKLISNNLQIDVEKEKDFILIVTLILSVLTIIIMIVLYFIFRKQAIVEENLHSLNALLTQNIIFSKTDLKGIITEVSDAFCMISGYTRVELMGQPHNIIRHPDMPRFAFKELWETIKSGHVWKGEVKNKRKDGTYYWVSATISPEYDLKGNITSYMAIRHDITLKKEHEQQSKQLLQAEKMASMGEMIGNIAHQWRQPLSGISTIASGIQLTYECDMVQSKEEIINSMDSIVSKTHYLSDTINTFRDFIKGEKVYKEIVLQDEIHQATSIVSTVLYDNAIIINDNINYDDRIKITLTTGELPQVLINIINNAKDVLLENKVLEPIVTLDLIKEDDKIIITIEDNGGGIADDILPKIFEPYFTTKHQSQGTGLGLHMSYQIISDSLKGKLYVKNTSIGAKFFIELPLF